MIGLSVAVGRFVEALFWGIFRAAGAISFAAIAAAAVLFGGWFLWRRRRQRRATVAAPRDPA